jgi:hypothetical protein
VKPTVANKTLNASVNKHSWEFRSSGKQPVGHRYISVNVAAVGCGRHLQWQIDVTWRDKTGLLWVGAAHTTARTHTIAHPSAHYSTHTIAQPYAHCSTHTIAHPSAHYSTHTIAQPYTHHCTPFRTHTNAHPSHTAHTHTPLLSRTTTRCPNCPSHFASTVVQIVMTTQQLFILIKPRRITKSRQNSVGTPPIADVIPLYWRHLTWRGPTSRQRNVYPP